MKKLAKAAYEAIPFKPFLFKTLHACWNPPERVYRHLHFRAPFELLLPGKTKIRMNHHGNQIENDLFWAGFGMGWEKTSLLLWAKLAARSATILDIGANTGVYALSARAMNETAEVIALEPVARTFARLRGNIELNGFDITALCLAASNRDGTATLYDPSSEHQYSASLNADMLRRQSGLSEVEVEVRRIDRILSDRQRPVPVVVKIDAERHEPQVLDGFGNLIRLLRPGFLVELLDSTIGRKAQAHFEGLDYVYFEILEGKGLRATTELGTAQRNYFLCPRELAHSLGFEDEVNHSLLSVEYRPRRA